MGFEHEFVEMHPPLRLDLDMGEGEIHQHRLAAPDAAPEIDAGGTLGLRPEQPLEEAALVETIREAVECCNRSRLCRIGLQLMRGNQNVVGDPYGSTHRECGPLGRFTFLSVPLKL